jgi:hypothetical protein
LRLAHTLRVTTNCGLPFASIKTSIETATKYMKTSILITIIFLLVSLINISARAEELDSYGGFTDITGEKTGFFHTEKIDGRWWLVTPEGNAFWGMGIAHPVTDFSKSAVTFSYLGDQEAYGTDFDSFQPTDDQEPKQANESSGSRSPRQTVPRNTRSLPLGDEGPKVISAEESSRQ